MTVTIDIYTPNQSAGLAHDFDVLDQTITGLFGRDVRVRRITVPLGYLAKAALDDPFPASLGQVGDVALFIERAFSADFVRGYKASAILINPEWFHATDLAACERYGHTILHKTRHYRADLARRLPALTHVHVGFTSTDPGVTVADWTSFSHFRGSSRLRMTQRLVDLWRANPHYPPLRVQAYGIDVGVNTHGWVGEGNTRFFFGKLPRADYLAALTGGGI